MAVSFIYGGNLITLRKLTAWLKSLTNIIKYTSPWPELKLTTLVVMSTDSWNTANVGVKHQLIKSSQYGPRKYQGNSFCPFETCSFLMISWPIFVCVPGLGLPTSCVMVCFMFNGLRWEDVVCFVDIGGIVDHRCLYFLLLMFNLFLRSQWSKWFGRNVTWIIFVRLPPPIRLTTTNITEILLKVSGC